MFLTPPEKDHNKKWKISYLQKVNTSSNGGFSIAMLVSFLEGYTPKV